MSQPALKIIIEAALMAAGSPLSVERIETLFDEDQQPSPSEIQQALAELKNDLLGRGIEITEVASGFRIQVCASVAPWVARLWEEKPQRYSRALLETLALIAYRQPVTRGDIEDVRGVVVSSGIMKTLLEREWIRVVGHRDVPGRPAMYATTREFLDYFGLKSLEDLPSLMEIRELDDSNRKLELGDDAEARQAPATDYRFTSDEEAAERSASVLAATDEDLAKAAALVAQVEDNVYEEASEGDGGGRKVRDLGQLLARLEATEKAKQESQNTDRTDGNAADDSEERSTSDSTQERVSMDEAQVNEHSVSSADVTDRVTNEDKTHE
jgi:segregation and condensation protein B